MIYFFKYFTRVEYLIFLPINSPLKMITAQLKQLQLEQFQESQKSGTEHTEELAKESARELVKKLTAIIANRAREVHEKIPTEIAEINAFILAHPKLIELENSTHGEVLVPSLKKDGTLLYNLVASVPNDYSVEIINHLITRCSDLSGRRDLLSVMISDRTISGALDMSQTFDLLVEKNLPKPTPEQIGALMDDSRLRQGCNAAKLAKSFLNQHQDVSLVKQIIDVPKNRSNALDKQALEDFLTKGIDAQDFTSRAVGLVKINNDSLLKKFLRGKAVVGFLEASKNHGEALDLAAQHKYIETFRMLIEAGFNPLKHEIGAPNCIATACQTQGKSTLQPYLEAIKRKFGQEVLTETLCEGDSALTNAVRGRAYIGTIKLLLESGATIEQNYVENLTTLACNGDAGAFEFLLKQGKLAKEKIPEVLEVVKNESDYVVASVFLDYLKKQDHPLASELEPVMAEKHKRLSEQNLFEICKLSGEKTFLAYTKEKPEYWLETHINNRDSKNNTALYYAITDNAYYNLVKLLLEGGANPNFIGQEEETKVALDAATLAVRNSEPATLKLVLQSRSLSTESICAAATELVKEENNEAVLTGAFIGGLSVEKLTAVPFEIRQILLQRSLESGQALFVKKIAESFNQDYLTPFIEKLFSKAIEAVDVDQVKIIAKDLEIKNLLLSRLKKSTIDLCSLESERDSLLGESKNYGAIEIPSTVFSSSLAQKLNAELGKEYTDRAFEIASSASEKSENAKAIFKILVDAGFETSKSEREIRSLEIDGKGRSSWCPKVDECCIICE